MIELVNVSKVYQETHALKIFTFLSNQEKSLGLLGKVALASPLLRLLNLMEQPE